MNESIKQIREDALNAIRKVPDTGALQSLSTSFIGRKGRVTAFLRNIASLPVAERPKAGKEANRVKKELEAAFEAAAKGLASDVADVAGTIDVTLPGRKPPFGSLHPITQVTRLICGVFERIGFDIAEGPEVESDYYNFEALNIPKDHPARDMQDTFYVSDNVVLRTHTSPIQIHYMTTHAPPVRIIAPGRVYRCDSDLTHTPMFHQVEGLLVDRGISFGDLKGVLTTFIREVFNANTAVRFRPSFFPFTEPSAEVDIRCVICGGKGCKVCSHTGWLEVLGCGMVHPAVFENVGYDTRANSGFAFGMGIERIAMLKFGINDLRLFFESDIRFLRQF